MLGRLDGPLANLLCIGLRTLQCSSSALSLVLKIGYIFTVVKEPSYLRDSCGKSTRRLTNNNTTTTAESAAPGRGDCQSGRLPSFGTSIGIEKAPPRIVWRFDW